MHENTQLLHIRKLVLELLTVKLWEAELRQGAQPDTHSFFLFKKETRTVCAAGFPSFEPVFLGSSRTEPGSLALVGGLFACRAVL